MVAMITNDGAHGSDWFVGTSCERNTEDWRSPVSDSDSTLCRCYCLAALAATGTEKTYCDRITAGTVAILRRDLASVTKNGHAYGTDTLVLGLVSRHPLIHPIQSQVVSQYFSSPFANYRVHSLFLSYFVRRMRRISLCTLKTKLTIVYCPFSLFA